MTSFMAISIIMGIVVAFMAFIAGIFEEYAARKALQLKMEQEAAERKRKAMQRRQAELKYKANLRKSGHRFWGGYIGGSHF